MTLKEHLQQMHQNDAAHHAAKAAAMHEMSEHFGALAAHHELTDPTAAKSHKNISACCKKIAESHATRGEECLEQHKNAGALATSEGSGGSSGDLKAVVDRLDKILSGVVPTQVSPIPLNPSPRQTIVPRHGQRAPDPDAISKVVPELQHLVRDDQEAE